MSDQEKFQHRAWLFKLDDFLWDRQIESDSKAGTLDKLTAEALADYEAGRAREV